MINPRTAGLRAVHPGEILREIVIPASRLTKAAIAERLGVSRQSLYSILDGSQAVTAAMALRLGRLFGNSPLFWMNLQSNYDLKRTGAALAGELAAISAIEHDADAAAEIETGAAVRWKSARPSVSIGRLAKTGKFVAKKLPARKPTAKNVPVAKKATGKAVARKPAAKSDPGAVVRTPPAKAG